MKKEIFLAIAIGFALGLVITFGIWTANRSLKQAQVQTLPTTDTPTPPETPTTSLPPTSTTPSAAPTSNGSLTISSPDDELLTNSSSIKLTGTAKPNANIVVLTDSGEQIIQADAKGAFTTDLTLDSGYNFIKVIAYDATGNPETKSLTVTYTSVKI